MSALHPILARKGRLAPFLSLALPLAAVLTGLLARPGAFRIGEAISLAWLLAFVSLFLYLSVWYVIRSAPLQGGNLVRTVVTHAVAAVVTTSVWVLSGAGAARLLVPLWGKSFPSRYAEQVPVLFSTGILLYLLSLALHGVLLAFEAGVARLSIDGREFLVPFEQVVKAHSIYRFTPADFDGQGSRQGARARRGRG